MQLTKEQNAVSSAVVDFSLHGDAPWLAVAGYAGTGKTTVMGSSAAALLRERPHMSVAFCAPTGKAAGVLEDKLRQFGALGANTTVGTVHSAIYRLDKKNSKGGVLAWHKKGNDELPYDLLVVDEASMVTQPMFRDILSYGIPVVFVGDSGQLPPVNDRIFEPLTTTEHVLTEVHRQALENPIIRWATEVRQGGRVPECNTPSFARLPRRSRAAVSLLNAFMQKSLDGSAMILCGRNRTRTGINVSARAALGFSGSLPEAGERLICLKNNKEFNLSNGQLFTVQSTQPCAANDSCYLLRLEGIPAPLWTFAGALHAQDGKALARRLGLEGTRIPETRDGVFQEEPCLFDYGYACSVHKAQGSEWDNVLLYEERMSAMTAADYRRWLYTGMTRAKKALCLLVE